MTQRRPAGEPAVVPPTMALAWGVAEQPSRGPKRALTIDRIARAGIEIAAADGLAAVSMARVAERVGVSTMALYRYVPAKDDLLEIMVDVALGAPPPQVPDEDWRAGMLRWARGVRDAYRANPWAMRVPITGPPMGPNNTRWLERALTAMRSTPLSYAQQLSFVITVSSFVRSEELLVADLHAGQAAGREPADYAKALSSLITADEFPRLVDAMAAGAVDDTDETDTDEVDFEFGIAIILDGLQALIDRRSARH